MQNRLDNTDSSWQQHYPTCSLQDKEIALKEYESAISNVHSQEKLFLNAANIILLFFASLASFIVNSYISGSVEQQNRFLSLPLDVIIICSLFIAFIIYILLKYFAERQKSILFDSRKAVMLRKMLGLDYGTQQLILPNWRIEGATNPFSIKLFPGWFTYVSYPFWVISLLSGILLYVFIEFIDTRFQFASSSIPFFLIPACSLAAWISLLSITYRRALYDLHESLVLSFTKTMARILGVPLVQNIEYFIYRAKLSVFETERLNVDTKQFYETLVFIEDREFYSHHGVSCRGIGRGLLGLLGLRKKTGGSTITQQLVRTLFITKLSYGIRRKSVEILLALWFETFFNKTQILDMYLSSVRFEKNVFGITNAIRYFYPENDIATNLSPAEIFFLIERVSNIKSSFLFLKIKDTLNQLQSSGRIDNNDINDIVRIYSHMNSVQKLIVPNNTNIDDLL